MFKRFSLTLEGNQHNVKITKRKNCKQIILKFNFKCKEPVVSIPYSLPYQAGLDFLKKNFDWVKKQANNYHNLQFQELQHVSLLGESYYIEKINSIKPKVEILHNPKQVLCFYKDHNSIHSQIVKALRQQARNHLTALAYQKAQLLGVNIKKIAIRDTISRWGSCSSKGNLNFSFRIIMAPAFVSDYIVSHEVAHLVEFNHSKNFWVLVDSLTPYRTRAEEWLLKHKYTLY